MAARVLREEITYTRDPELSGKLMCDGGDLGLL